MHTSTQTDDRSILPCLRLSLAALVVALAALGSATPARACSKEQCTPPVRLFARDATVPGNLVYFQLLGGVNVDGDLQPPSPLRLETAEGEPISASVQTIGGDRVFAPDQTIAPGTRVVLKYRPNCFPAEAGTEEAEYAFTIGEAFSEVLLTGAALQITKEGEGESSDETFVELRYDYDASVGAKQLAHLVDWVPTIDGVKAPLGEDALSTRVTTLCTRSEEVIRDGCGALSFVPAGEHDVVARGKIIGFGDLPETRLSVETHCAAPSDDDGADASPADTVEAASSDGGCSLAAGPQSGASYLLALFGLIASRTRTRRRRAEARRQLWGTALRR